MTDLAPIYILCAHGERQAARDLAEAGIACWAPTYERLKPRVRNRPAHTVPAPLMPGYVFARLGPEDFAKASAQERVFGVLSNDRGPVPVPEAEWVKVLLMAISGRFDEAGPAKKAQPRGNRRRRIVKLQEFCDALKASQLKSPTNSGSFTVGGELVSDGHRPSQRSTGPSRTTAETKVRSFANLKTQIGAS
jgi:hypothetical protein